MTNTLDQCPVAAAAPRHTRRVPEAWDQLVAETQQHIEQYEQKPGRIAKAAATATLEMVQALPDEELDTNRYYGLGVITCEVMRSLAVPEGRALVVSSASTAISRQSHANRRASRGWPRRGIRLADLNGPQDQNLPSVHRAATSLLPAIRKRLEPAPSLLTDSLVAAASHRQEPPEPASSLGKLSFDQRAGYATLQVLQNLLAGALVMYGTGLELEVDRRRQAGNAPVESNPLVRSLTDTSYRLQPENLSRAAMYAARMRVDEFLLLVPTMRRLAMNDDGKITFDNSAHKAATLGPADKQYSLHDSRLACPASYVVGAIPTIMELVPEIVARADKSVVRGTPRWSKA